MVGLQSSKSKYNTDGFANKEDFSNLNVHNKYTELLADATNLALADSSISQYKTASKCNAGAKEATRTDMSLPFNIIKTLNYVGYLLIAKRNELSSKNCWTIPHLSAVRMTQLCKSYTKRERTMGQCEENTGT